MQIFSQKNNEQWMVNNSDSHHHSSTHTENTGDSEDLISKIKMHFI